MSLSRSLGVNTTAIAPNLITFSDTNRTILSSECVGSNLIVIQTGVLTADRILTLPAANSVSAGYQIIVIDQSGSASWWYPIKVTSTGSDLINGIGASSPFWLELPWVISIFTSNGISNWTGSVPQWGRPDIQLQSWEMYSNNITNGSGIGDGLILGLASGATYSVVRESSSFGNFRGTLANSANSVFSIQTSAGSANLYSNQSNAIYRYTSRIRIDTNPTATEDYILNFGIGDFGNTPPTTDGFVFQINRNLSTTNLYATTANNGSRTNIDTAIAFPDGYVKYGIEFDGNTQTAKFFVGHTEVSGGGISTNIPGSARTLSPGWRCLRVTSTGSINVATIDYQKVLIIPNTFR